MHYTVYLPNRWDFQADHLPGGVPAQLSGDNSWKASGVGEISRYTNKAADGTISP